MIEYLILSILFASAAFLSRSRRAVDIAAGCFFGVQVVLAALLLSDARGSVGDLGIFAFDTLGILFHLLMVLTLGFVMLHSRRYLHEDTLSAYRTYFALLMMLSTAITCVYYADNAAVTWIFLEATTICSAGIIYYRHDQHALEATWKYIFICSTGIAMAYLGILLLCTVVRDGSLDYSSLAATISGGNPLYLKVAFLLIVAGYSCKMEIFPLYTVGVDANFAAPAPASAFISTALVNAGFVAIMRIYLLYARCEGEVFDWARHVLILIGIVTLAVGAMFLRHTNNYKRFLSYSTIENMGIVAIGMGVGGAALWAAVFHVACHTLVKSSLFLQLGVVRQIYDSYRINRLGDYININRVGAVGILIGTVVLLAFPPSPLFISEIVVFREIVAAGDWWLIAAMLVLLCMVIYAVWSRALRLNYHPNQDELHLSHVDRRLSYSAMILLLGAIVLGLWQPEALSRAIDTITTL